MKYERLRELYAMLGGIPKGQLNMSVWRGVSSDGAAGDALLKECGYSACAVGWACAYPQFKAEGLAYFNGQPQYRDFDSWEAVESFFGLKTEEAYELFSARSEELDNTLRAVMARILVFLLRKGAITTTRYDECFEELPA